MRAQAPLGGIESSSLTRASAACQSSPRPERASACRTAPVRARGRRPRRERLRYVPGRSSGTASASTRSLAQRSEPVEPGSHVRRAPNDRPRGCVLRNRSPSCSVAALDASRIGETEQAGKPSMPRASASRSGARPSASPSASRASAAAKQREFKTHGVSRFPATASSTGANPSIRSPTCEQFEPTTTATPCTRWCGVSRARAASAAPQDGGLVSGRASRTPGWHNQESATKPGSHSKNVERAATT